jgi:hypothetical protein
MVCSNYVIEIRAILLYNKDSKNLERTCYFVKFCSTILTKTRLFFAST